ncbi:MAG TPA: hypothetical protein VMV40_02385 [Acidiferrobacter sp.]|nr:hypothetical protein [Acidiferrobacter sp.]
MKKQSLVAVAVAAVCFAGVAQATNWLQLEGTEPNGIAAPIKVFGFIQPTYQDTGGSAVNGLVGPAATPFNGAVPRFNEVAPQHTASTGFGILRARLGVRGTVLPVNNKVDYFLMAEFGNNGYTETGSGGSTPRITDASVTFNEIPGARVRVGIFKTPGPEEDLQGIPDFDYVNFTNVSGQLILNQFVTGPAYAGGTTGTPGIGAGGYAVTSAPINAARDTGVQVFDWFNNGPWQFAYAGMIANGSTLYANNTANTPSYYGLLQEAYIFNHSKGPHQAGISGWVWGHVGHEGLDVSNGTGLGFTQQDYTYKRYGLGAQFRSGFMKPGALRVTGELMRGTGWIITPEPFANTATGAAGAGTCGTASATSNGLCTEALYPSADNAAVGGYVEAGFFVSTHWDLEARYDQYNRLTNNPGLERIFKTTTLGIQYYISPKARVTLNYAFNRIDVPHLAAISPAGAQTNALAVTSAKDNAIALQTTLIF